MAININTKLGPTGTNRKLAKMTFLIEPRDKILSGKFFENKFEGIRNFFEKNPKIPKGLLPFPVMYNPETLKVKYESAYTELKTIGKEKSSLHYQYIKPHKLDVDLFFDATGASTSGGITNFNGNGADNFLAKIANATDGIDSILQPFIRLSLFVNKEQHKPNYVWVIWGAILFKGIVKTIDVDYTMFDRIGRPLRAKVKVSMSSSTKNDKEATNANESPDLTKVHLVKAGDTLPLIAQGEYNDESLYMQLAAANNLKNYRNLKVGQSIILPPLTKDI